MIIPNNNIYIYIYCTRRLGFCLFALGGMGGLVFSACYKQSAMVGARAKLNEVLTRLNSTYSSRGLYFSVGENVLYSYGRRGRSNMQRIPRIKISFNAPLAVGTAMPTNQPGFVNVVGQIPVASAYAQPVPQPQPIVAPATAPTAPGSSSGVNELQQLVQMYNNGALTQDEFARAKAKLLA